ncbi:13390_t:CDS:1 [Ambispora leptoticha]|uniref:13390_t:CDS:1 n=1 Tax=Ambispora leptoticha TaxID=144679 RepID=A0A9N9AWX5_9GLOM|nr:13390_t:CDS:1 [Ambispora leptoticha]
MPPQVAMHASQSPDSQAINEQTIAELMQQGFVSEAEELLPPPPHLPPTSAFSTDAQTQEGSDGPDYHEFLCQYLYQNFVNGEFCNLLVHVPFREPPYQLHAHIVSKSPYLFHLLTNAVATTESDYTHPISIALNELVDPYITDEAFTICLSHLYLSQMHCVTGENAHHVLAAASFLGIGDLCEFSANAACENINEHNVVAYIEWSDHASPYGGYTQQIRERAYTFLLRDFPEMTSAFGENGSTGPGYKRLCGYYVQLPFDLLRLCLESKELQVPSVQKRVQLAQDVVTTWNQMNSNEQAIVTTGFTEDQAVLISKTTSRRIKKN